MIIRICILIITLTAAYTDAVSWKISNYHIVFWLVTGILMRIFSPWIWYIENESVIVIHAGGILNGYGIEDGLKGMLIALLILGWLYGIGKIGAGDIKLFAVLGMWMGASEILWCMLMCFVFAFAAGIIRFIYCRLKNTTSACGFFKQKIHIAVYIFASAVLYAAGVY